MVPPADAAETLHLAGPWDMQAGSEGVGRGEMPKQGVPWLGLNV